MIGQEVVFLAEHFPTLSSNYGVMTMQIKLVHFRKSSLIHREN